jgi:hypothetical protein
MREAAAGSRSDRVIACCEPFRLIRSHEPFCPIATPSAMAFLDARQNATGAFLLTVALLAMSYFWGIMRDNWKP